VIGVDTNVLVRLVVSDNEAQHALAVRFFAERSPKDPAFIPLLVIAEFAWVLEKRFRFARARVLDVLRALLSTVDVVVEQHEAVAEALAHAETPKIDIADALIAEVSRRNGCQRVVTFDKTAARLVQGMDVLK